MNERAAIITGAGGFVGCAIAAGLLALGWQVVNNGFGEGYLLHLAVDPANPARLFAITGNGEVLTSTDAGANWRAIGQ